MRQRGYYAESASKVTKHWGRPWADLSLSGGDAGRASQPKLSAPRQARCRGWARHVQEGPLIMPDRRDRRTGGARTDGDEARRAVVGHCILSGRVAGRAARLNPSATCHVWCRRWTGTWRSDPLPCPGGRHRRRVSALSTPFHRAFAPRARVALSSLAVSAMAQLSGAEPQGHRHLTPPPQAPRLPPRTRGG
ncbi:hypothetical protein CLV78_101377 [Aliiruegeria haliotis]|uniref:Uncharacterized protein n=1 Tax=Aliiruegeria haliotis TaxID=1280846 RepID=A0A2T0RYR7_9RHOB|nr:hypothetical protein CLV78_101377 [Aliiruegeria haliotis]